ncbi:hypothetical protein P7C71_g4815, partial [Lecanoromycetidae sp. Uapishka_2]
MEDLSQNPPTEINPYEALEIETTATSAEVKSAYKKLALRHHPDKVHPDVRNAANVKFQEIAFAYAILSDERRRKRYDTTGNTSESLHLEDDDFNWNDFFRAQWSDHVTGKTLKTFKDKYQNSEEERSDVLAAYTLAKGDLNAIFKQVMLSNPLDDEERFRGYIDQAIGDEEVEAFQAYTKESLNKKEKRHKAAKKEGLEAEEHAKKIGVYDQLFSEENGGSGKKGKKEKKGAGDDGLAALIQQRQKARAGNFLDDLEAKYAPGKKQNGKKRKIEEPPEEKFQKNRRQKKRKSSSEEEEDDADVDAAVEAEEEKEDDDDEDEDEEEEVVKPAKSKSRSRGTRAGRKSRKKGIA